MRIATGNDFLGRPVFCRSDVLACYAFHALREKETVTAEEYETLISHVYGNTLGLYSITLRLLGTCKNRNSVIVAWDIKDYTPIFYDQAIEMSHDPAYERHKRACDLWEHSSKHDKHPYSSLEETPWPGAPPKLTDEQKQRLKAMHNVAIRKPLKHENTMIHIEKHCISGSNKNSLLRVQIGYTGFFIGYGWLPKCFGSGVCWGFFAPVKCESGYKRTGFYGEFLPVLDSPVAHWPKWYAAAWRALSFNFALA